MNVSEFALRELSLFENIELDVLKAKSYAELEQMIKNMRISKTKYNPSSKDIQYRHVIKTFFIPFAYLTKYWSEDEIICACIINNISESDVCCEDFIKSGYKCPKTPCDYIKTSTELANEYDFFGNLVSNLMFEKCDVYRVTNPNQTTIHGKVIQYLLYSKYPQLKKFEFRFYGMTDPDHYEIYPECKIYTPFDALMNKDVNAIIERNRAHCRCAFYGDYTSKNLEIRLESDIVKELFETIKTM